MYDRITNDKILDIAGVSDIEMIVRKRQLRWAGHTCGTHVRLPNPKTVVVWRAKSANNRARTVGRPPLR